MILAHIMPIFSTVFLLPIGFGLWKRRGNAYFTAQLLSLFALVAVIVILHRTGPLPATDALLALTLGPMTGTTLAALIFRR